jgi:hypothetical protein
MRAFEVSLNSKKLCLAGIGDDGVLSAIVNWVPRKGKGDLFLQVGGLAGSSDEHVSWENQRPLRIGDTIEVKIIDAESVDAPKKRKPIDRGQRLEQQKRYVREMAKQLGWTIQAKRRKTRATS